MHDQRSSPRARRERLRSLDRLLLDEMDSAGAISEARLKELCQAGEHFGDMKIDELTLQEWWAFSRRRQLIEQPHNPVNPGELALTERGERRLDQAREESALPSAGWEKKVLVRILSFCLPSIAGLLAIAAFAEKDTAAFLVVAGVLAALTLGILCSWLISAIVLEPIWHRWLMPLGIRMNVDWLAGRELRIGFSKLKASQPIRLPGAPEET